MGLLRDDRHLKGTLPQVVATPPSCDGHAIEAGWEDGRPYLTVRGQDGFPHRLDVRPGATLNLEVLAARRCVGPWTAEGRTPCPDDAPADHFDQCARCHPLPDRECVFNPRCHDCTRPLCRGTHKLYLAYYAELPKVGMTRASRGVDRLVEQGADAYAILAHPSDRSEARRLEDLVTRRFGIPQSRRVDEILPRLARPTPWAAIERHYASIRTAIGESLGTAPGDLVRAPPPPGAFPLPAEPTLAGIEGHHAGRIVGAKGRHLFYEAATAHRPPGPARIWALNMGAVVTHHVRFEPTTSEPSNTAPFFGHPGPRLAQSG